MRRSITIPVSVTINWNPSQPRDSEGKWGSGGGGGSSARVKSLPNAGGGGFGSGSATGGKHEGVDAEKFNKPPAPFTLDESKLDNPDLAEKEMERAMKAQYGKEVPLFHEAPLSALESIKKNGLTSSTSAEETNFATIGMPSGFVTSSDKLIVQFNVRSAGQVSRTAKGFKTDKIMPDMRYDPDNAAGDLLREHKGVYGADVAFGGRIGPNDINEILVVRGGKVMSKLKPPFDNESRVGVSYR